MCVIRISKIGNEGGRILVAINSTQELACSYFKIYLIIIIIINCLF